MYKNELSLEQVVIANQFVKEKEYWLDKLQGELEKTYFPYDFPGNNESRQEAKSKIGLHFSEEIDSRLLSIAGNSERRLLMLLAAGLLVLLHKYTEKKDIIIGTPILKQEVQGDFVNTLLILRDRLEAGTTFKELLYRVKQTLVEATENQNYPIKSLTRELKLHSPVSGDENPLFDCIILLENIHERGYIEDSPFNILFSFKVEQEKIPGHIEYNSTLYSEDMINQIARHFQHLFHHVLFNLDLPLDEIPVLSGDDKGRLLYEFNKNETIPIDFNTIVDWFENQVKKNLHRIALEYDNQQIDYLELNRKANKLARVLIEKGMRQDSITVLILRPSLEMAIAILAVLKTGGAYLPIDPELPSTRIEYIINDSNAKCLLTDSDLRETLPYLLKNLFEGEIIMAHHDYNEENNANIGIQYKSDALAYVIYTSGTTGLPKGVLIEHKGIINYIGWRYHTYRYSVKDITLQLLSYNFDGFYSNFYSGLTSGGTLILVPDYKILDIGYITGLIERRGVTNTSIIPRIFDVFIEQAAARELKSLRFVVLAGEKPGDKQVEKIKNKIPDIILANEYGPSELSVTTTANPSLQTTKTSVIGKPISNMKVFILNSTFDIVPIGVTGELYATGPGLARGYLNNPRLTQEKFVENPFEKDSFLYRTGDIARWLFDGDIEFSGRTDHQVKVRGYRIEPEEIERQLSEHTDIKETIITTRQDERGDSYICAYIIPQRDITVHELREYLSTNLPEYMIPSYFVSLEEWPLSSSGKVDLKRLPPPQVSVSLEKYAGPRDKIEKKLTEIWAEVLGIEKDVIGIDSNFFEMGGHSLTVTVLTNRIHKDLDVKIPVIEIFKSPSIRAVGEYIKSARLDIFTSIKAVEQKEYYPLSSPQHRLYILQEMLRNSTAYNVYLTFQLEGYLEKERLENTFRKLIDRHESLRTSFSMLGEKPIQKIHKDVVFKIENYDASQAEIEDIIRQFIRPFDLSQSPLLRVGLIEIEKHRNILLVDMHHIVTDEVAHEILIKNFTVLYNGGELPPLRLQYKDYTEWQRDEAARKFYKQQEEYWLKEFAGEIPVLNLPTDFPRPPIQNFEGNLIGAVIGEEETRKLNQIALSQSATLFMTLLGTFIIFLSKLSGQDDIIVGTPIIVRNHADLEKIIGMFTNTIAFSNTISGEQRIEECLMGINERTIEAFENQDYLFEDIVEKVTVERDVSRNPIFDVMFAYLDDFAVSKEPQEQEIKNLKLKSYPVEHRTTKFDLGFSVIERDGKIFFSFEYCTKLFKKETIERFTAYFKKVISAVVKEPGRRLNQIEVISEEEKNRILFDFNDTQTDYPKNKTIYQLYEEQAENIPDNIAAIGPSLSMRAKHSDVFTNADASSAYHISYGQLNEKANRLALELKNKGAIPDDIVGIIVERSVEMLIGILGILKAGGAYLPVDPEYPSERIHYMLKDSGASLLVTTDNLAKEGEKVGKWEGKKILIEETPGFQKNSAHPLTFLPSSLTNSSNLATTQRPLTTSPAYIIYTSGSTGRPKGVMVEHRNVVRLVKNDSYIHYSMGDRLLPTGSTAFDISTFEIWSPLLNGVMLLVVPKEVLLNAEMLKNALVKHDISILHLIPQLFNQMAAQDIELFAGLRCLLVGGDLVRSEYVTKLWQRYNNLRIHHMYGPTENTTFSTFFPVERICEYNIPIGRPINNSIVFIVDKYIHLQPVGLTGELCVGGEGLARGYTNQPELTAEKFIRFEVKVEGGKGSLGPILYTPGEEIRHKKASKNAKKISTYSSTYPLTYSPYSIIYKTGDLARWLADGNIEFLGRIDHQVKIRGFRVELGEIENCLLRISGIKEAVVLAREESIGDKYICAYIVSDGKYKIVEVLEYLSKELPDYMIPSYFVPLEKIPLTPNGKIDRKVLPKPEVERGETYTGPRNKIERKLIELWTEVLGRDVLHASQLQSSIGLDDHFFQLGGHSLKATIMVSKIHKEFNIKISMAEIFMFPTIRKLSKYIEDAVEEAYQPIEPAEKKEFYPLSPGQQRIYILQQMDPNITTYNLPTATKLGSVVDKKKLERVFEKLLSRHESLRTSFEMIDEKPMQRVHQVVDFTIEFFQDRSTKEITSTFENFMKPFDLTRVPLMRAGLVKAGEEYVLMVDIHHIVTDRSSQQVLIDDFFALYRGDNLPPLNLQFKDYSEWLNTKREKNFFRKQEEYWLNEFATQIPVLKLPYDFDPSPERASDIRVVDFKIPGKGTKDLRKLAKEEGVTMFMILLATFNILLSKISGQEDIIIGTPTAGRQHEDLQPLVGMFVNTLALRNYPNSDSTFTRFLDDVKTKTLRAFANQDYPLENLIDKLPVKRDANLNPLFKVFFGSHEIHEGEGIDSDTELPETDENMIDPGIKLESTSFELGVGYIISNVIYIHLAYFSALFTFSTIQKIIDFWIDIIKQVTLNKEVKLKDIKMSHDLIDVSSAILKEDKNDFVF